MPKRKDIKSILIIGSGPIVIGQACEFDYSGAQACKALREEGYSIVLVNSNPATIMTDPAMADKTYIEPLTPEILTKIIEKERPDAVLPTLGGQTALNLAVTLAKQGVFKKYGVEMLAANQAVIEKAEDRHLFKEAMLKIGLDMPNSEVAYTMEDARETAGRIGFPCVVRPAFTLGGTGGGIAYTMVELEAIVKRGLNDSIISEVLIEESIIGWKEFELEVMRDKKDNVVIVCSIENLDPMGVHTGDSITVAPAQTLSDVEYQTMRDAAIRVIREIGVDTGGSNIQFAINPDNGRMIVIEMNPRVSRSSALASKATGFPIAKFAAKLAVGYTLDELQNDITKKTPACFEPTLDYCVVKIPRFTFEKFPKTATTLGTAMKSVGEAMAIGRTFKEAFQKGIRSLEIKRFGFGFDGKDYQNLSKAELENGLKKPNPNRLFFIKYALDKGKSIDWIFELTKIDRWFLYQMKQINDFGHDLTPGASPLLRSGEGSSPSLRVSVEKDEVRKAKRLGFSDVQLSKILGLKDDLAVRELRKKLGVIPTYKLVDTCAGEFEAFTPYFYSTYETEDESTISKKKKIMILGGGPNRIGQGIEFDYCCVHASFAAQEMGFESIMVNSNPETVSTDFDISDKLYFEPLTIEDVLNIYDAEKPEGVIVQFGGQTPLNLCKKLTQAQVKILGTSYESIDIAEDREKFQKMLKKLGLRQPENGTAITVNEAIAIANRVHYPVVVRPSYVLGGASMEIVYTEADLRKYVAKAADVSEDAPILIDKYLDNATEVDVDGLSDGDDCVIAAIMQHIEQAGIHSGDSACCIPTFSLKPKVLDEIRGATRALAKELRVVGLMNIQFAVKNDVLYVLEVNPRASRTVPYVSKTTGIPWAKMATFVMLGKKIKDLNVREIIPKHFAIKEAVFPFNKFPGIDILLGPEMKSTGEVMGIDKNFGLAFFKSQLAVGNVIPFSGKVFVTVQDSDKVAVVEPVKTLAKMGFEIVATTGTAKVLAQHGVKTTVIRKIAEGSPNVVELIRNRKIDLVINTPDLKNPNFDDEVKMRQATLEYRVPIFTTIQALFATVEALEAVGAEKGLQVKAIQEYFAAKTPVKTGE